MRIYESSPVRAPPFPSRNSVISSLLNSVVNLTWNFRYSTIKPIPKARITPPPIEIHAISRGPYPFPK
jgi:hypothetical protein